MKVDVKLWKAKAGHEEHRLMDKDFYVYAEDIRKYEPVEDCLETSLKIMEDLFDDYSFIVDYETMPEKFDVEQFIMKNYKVFETIINYLEATFNINVSSYYNINDILGMTVVFEDIVSIDVPYSSMLVLCRRFWDYGPDDIVGVLHEKMANETYACYMRRMQRKTGKR